MEPHFVHPLSSLETIDTDEGQKEVMNSWAFASMIWTSAVTGNTNALAIATELFTNKHEIPTFLEASKAGNEAAIAGAIAIIAFAIDDKLAEAFEPSKGSEP
ncbi:hypothetical protein QUA74_10955 [Microcoleus sp. LAD1_D3]|uniref:hypothetical protein n=1 Tax=Microcoleus sp. LAD1_D3 TaxID=2819365 RepID=UPI002FD1CC2E